MISVLNSGHFNIIGQRQKSLGINVPGNVLILFKITNDPNCSAFEPIFAKLASVENRAICASLDLQQYRNVYQLAKDTSTPLNAVPLLILYVNGKPHAKFNGQKNIKSIQEFITKVLSHTPPVQQQSSSTFMNSQQMYRPSPNNQQQRSWEPEIGKSPSLKGVIKGGYMNGMNVEEEDEKKLRIPDSVIPHNTPWEAEMQEFGEPN